MKTDFTYSDHDEEVIKIESEEDLVDAILNEGADRISVTNKSNIDDEYLLAYQFYLNSCASLCYLAFINKETHEIDYFSDDLDEDEFEDIFDNWNLEVKNNG